MIGAAVARKAGFHNNKQSHTTKIKSSSHRNSASAADVLELRHFPTAIFGIGIISILFGVALFIYLPLKERNSLEEIYSCDPSQL